MNYLKASQSFATFMADALYGEGGYYTRGLNFLTTPPRDFTTAPELTPLFGAVLANWVAAQWQRLACPTAFNLAELGPGRGSLMLGLLTHLQSAHPSCYAVLVQVVLVEVSPVLTTLQQQTLHAFPQCIWRNELQPTSYAQTPTLLIANEVLDALPAQPYRLTATGWEELWVENNALVWRPCPQPPLPHNWQPTVGAQFEHLPDMANLLGQIKAVAAAALLIDYGAENLPPAGAETLQALQHHKPVPLLHEAGNTDLTVHINFAEVAHQLGATNCTLTSLAGFLLGHGLTELALPLLQTHPPHLPTESALQRLLHPAQMGNLHKVLCYTRSTP